MQNSATYHPTFKDNPVLKWFQLPEGGLIDAIDAAIYWNIETKPTIKVKNVAVAYFPRKKMKELGYNGHPAWDAKAACYNGKIFSASSGNCFSEWMRYSNEKPPPCDSESNSKLGYSPDADFEYLRACGFPTFEEAKRAVIEFSYIRECEWARDPSFDIAALVKPYTKEELNKYKQRQIEEEIRSLEYAEKEIEFTEIVNHKIQSGEMIVPDGVSIVGTGLMIHLCAADCNESAPVNVLSRQFDTLQEQIFGKSIK